MHLKQIECFLELSETLNFSETADNMALTQPAVSHQIKSLEEEIGVQLFTRNKRNVSLTRSGISFYNDIKDVYNRINISIVNAKNLCKKYKSELHIGYDNHIFEKEKFPLIISRFKELFPECNLILNPVDYKERKSHLLSNKSDIILTFRENISDLNDFNFVELLKGYLICIVPKSHPFSGRNFLYLEDFKKENIIFLDPMNSFGEMAKIQNRLLIQSPDSNIYFSNSIDICCTMIKSGIGVSIIPSFLYHKEKELVKIPIKFTSSFSYGILSLSRNNKEEVKEFISITKKIFKTKLY